ncbi:MAG: hypothetical protein E6713_09040 [Sporomusaceae bacterium]|nr:hypothetical protein [Sporomusaceae bacterium]
MDKAEIHSSIALKTFLAEEKVLRLAEAGGVQATLVETRFEKGGQWINDFEIEGSTGKIEAFLRRVKDIETR